MVKREDAFALAGVADAHSSSSTVGVPVLADGSDGSVEIVGKIVGVGLTLPLRFGSSACPQAASNATHTSVEAIGTVSLSSIADRLSLFECTPYIQLTSKLLGWFHDASRVKVYASGVRRTPGCFALSIGTASGFGGKRHISLLQRLAYARTPVTPKGWRKTARIFYWPMDRLWINERCKCRKPCNYCVLATRSPPCARRQRTAIHACMPQIRRHAGPGHQASRLCAERVT